MEERDTLRKRFSETAENIADLSKQHSSSKVLEFSGGYEEPEITLFEKQVNLVVDGDKSRPILIGASIKKEPVVPTSKSKNDRRLKANWDRDQRKIKNGAIKLYELGDDHKADILNPEPYLGADWSIELNTAFIIGSIQSGRNINLVTDWTSYKAMGSGLLNNGTFWELLSLQRCGYKFIKGDDDKIIAIREGELKDDYVKMVRDTFLEYTEITNIKNRFGYDYIDREFPKYKTEIVKLMTSFSSAQKQTMPSRSSTAAQNEETKPHHSSSPT